LRFENLDVVQAETNGAPAEERIELVAGIDRSRRELITAKVERANNERIGSDALRDFSIFFVLKVLAWERAPVQIKKLGAIKSDPFGTVGRDRFDVAGQCDIGREDNVPPISRDRFRFAQLAQLRRNLDSARLNFAIVGQRLRFRIDNEQPVGAIDQHVPAGLQSVRDIVQTDDRWNAKGTRDNGRVRRATAKISRDPQHVFSIHHRRVGWREIVRH